MYLQILIAQNWVFFKIATSVRFFLKRFLKFRKFQPRYSCKIYSDIKRVYSENARSTMFYQLKIWLGILILYSFVLQNWCRFGEDLRRQHICTSFVVRNYIVLKCLVKSSVDKTLYYVFYFNYSIIVIRVLEYFYSLSRAL